MRRKILNPKTGRAVYENGRVGKLILQESSAKYKVLCCASLRTLVRRFLVYERFVDYYIKERNEFYRLCDTSKNIDAFYKKALRHVRLNKAISINEIERFYFAFLKKNIRYNLFNNTDLLIEHNKTFRTRIKNLLKKRQVRLLLPSFKKYILSLNNSILHKHNTHRERLKKYINNCFFLFRRNDITMFW